MSRPFLPIGGFFALVLGIVGTAIAADSSQSSSSGSSSSSNSSSSSSSPGAGPVYITVGDIVGDVVKVDSNGISVRVTWYTMQPPKGGNRNQGNWHRGSSGRNPMQMYQHMMMMQQRMGTPKKQTHDYVMNFTGDATARTMHLPPKFDAEGKKQGYNLEEFAAIKGNPHLPGFKSDLSSLKVGQLVEAHVVHTKGSPKETLVRWALIINEQNVGKMPASTLKSNSPSKKNK